MDSPIGLLTSSTPQEVLNQSSVLSELSTVDSSQIARYLAASHQLLNAQQQASRTKLGILAIKNSIGKRLHKLKTLQGQEETLLAQLTPVARTKVTQGGGNGGTGGTGGTGGSNPKPPPVSGQAGKAVDYAYEMIGCTYFYGGTGPCNAPGYDCSGLMMMAWASAEGLDPEGQLRPDGRPAAGLAAHGVRRVHDGQPGTGRHPRLRRQLARRHVHRRRLSDRRTLGWPPRREGSAIRLVLRGAGRRGQAVAGIS